ncbi:HAMP domain-containing histidine kinase, partial [bacterium]|nr:HAMP domain-containing histidine kinase [bacterium]
KKRGWGLGLTLAKRIVEEYHRGKLYLAESKPKQGSTFVISLPVA